MPGVPAAGPLTYSSGMASSLTGPQQTLLTHLRQLARFYERAACHLDWRYTSTQALVLERGCWYRAPALNEKDPAAEGECFRAAAQLARTTQGLIAVEGFALDDLGHVYEHAWCVTPQDETVDPAWGAIGVAYLGVPISAPLRAAATAHSGVDTVLFAREKSDFRVEREGLPPEATLSQTEH